MIDTHCHILPAIDDGASDLETSIEMLKIAEKSGIKKIITTPHFITNRFENNFQSVLEHVQKLNVEVKGNNITVELFPGQEVMADKYTLSLYKQGVLGGLNNSKYMLIEFPMDVLPDDALDIIYELKLLGIKPIIAHPERYLYVQENLTDMNKFLAEKCLFQINATSITGLFGKKVKETTIKLIENGACQFIASDAHSTGKRCPDIVDAMQFVKQNYNEVYSKVQKNAQCVLENEPIEFHIKKFEEKKGFFSFMFKK